jgi:hypothetical protein
MTQTLLSVFTRAPFWSPWRDPKFRFTERTMLESFTAITAALCLTFVSLSTAGCASQQTIADLVAVVGTSVASLEALEGNTAAVAKIQSDAAAATAQVLAWKPGSPTQDVTAALNLVEDDLNVLPVSSQDQALVDLAIGTLDQILALIPATPASPVISATVSHIVHRPIVLTAEPPKNVKEYTGRWNKLAEKNSATISAKIK